MDPQQAAEAVAAAGEVFTDVKAPSKQVGGVLPGPRRSPALPEEEPPQEDAGTGGGAVGTGREGARPQARPGEVGSGGHEGVAEWEAKWESPGGVEASSPAVGAAGAAGATGAGGMGEHDTSFSETSRPDQRTGEDTRSAGGIKRPSGATQAPTEQGLPADVPRVSDEADPLAAATVETVTESVKEHRGRLPGTAWVCPALHLLCWALICVPPDGMLPKSVPASIHVSQASFYTGAVLAAAALAVGLHALFDISGSFRGVPKPAQRATLRTRGTYRIVRHPLYFAQVLCFLALSLVTGSTLRYATTALLVLVLGVRSLAEEISLAKRYGSEFLEYKKRTKGYIPWVY